MRFLLSVRFSLFLASFFLFFVSVFPAHASIPTTIGYQGVLKNANGTAQNGSYAFTFRLYDALTNGTLLWSETQAHVAVSDGFFSVALGSSTAFPLSFSFSQPLYLTTEVNSDGEMTPRVPITSVPFSRVAAGVEIQDEEPGTGSAGRLYYNNTAGTLHYYDETVASWKRLDAETSLNGLTDTIQTFVAATSSGLNLSISSTSGTHTFDLSASSGFSVPLTASTTDWQSTFSLVHASSSFWEAMTQLVSASSSEWGTAYNRSVSSWTGPLRFSHGVVSLDQATSGTDGYLSGTDWVIFNNKQSALGFIPENQTNKSTDSALGSSDILFPSQNAVKTYVDTSLSGKQNSLTIGNLLGTSNQISVSGGASAILGSGVTLSLPQDIGIGSSPTFAGMTLTNATATNLSVSGNVRFGSYSGVLFGSSGAVSALTDGTNGQVLTTNGSGAYSWTTPQSSVSSFSGISDTSANLAAAITNETGSGLAVFNTSPTFTTDIRSPMVIGGTGTGSTLIFKTTTGVGTTGADMIFQVGDNGATEAMRIANNGNVGIHDATPSELFTVGTGGLFKINSSGIVLTPSGTSSAPAYTFTGDTNTGLFNPSADTLGFSLGGEEAMRIAKSTLGYSDLETVFLLHGEQGGTNIVDSSSAPKSILPYNVYQVTTPHKIGDQSLRFNMVSSDELLTVTNSTDFDFGSGDYTIDFWINPATIPSGYQFIIDRRGSVDQTGWVVYHEPGGGGRLEFLSSSASSWNTDLSGNWPTINTWSHVAIVRYGATVTMYINGISTASTTANSIGSVNANLTIGRGHIAGFQDAFKGYLDEVHFSKGIALWRGNFTPPTQPYPWSSDQYPGYVGINNSSPATLLHVGSSSTNSGNLLTIQDSNGTCTLNPSSNASWSCTSDRDLKHDIQDLSVGLDAVLRLRPTTFKMNVDESEHTGFIAQEVQEIFPQLVGVSPDGHLTLAEGGMMPYMVKAIQETALRIDAFTTSTALSTAGFMDLLTSIQQEQPRDALSYITARLEHAMKPIVDFVALRVTAIDGSFERVHTHQLCVKDSSGQDVCLGGDELRRLLQEEHPTTSSSVNSSPSSKNALENSSSTISAQESSSTTTSELIPISTEPETPSVTEESTSVSQTPEKEPEQSTPPQEGSSSDASLLGNPL